MKMSSYEMRNYEVKVPSTLVQAVEPMTREKAERIAKVFSKKLVENLVKGRVTDERTLPRGEPIDGVEITVRAGVDFRIETIVVPRHCAKFFAITGIRIGHREQVMVGQMMPAEAFSKKRVRLDLDTARRLDAVTITVLNISGRPRRFTARLIGTAGR